mmetsp:Transcript_14778/g.14880  ORF Transcript_14778/g.14880 Transcript_14778/m.14880 type:complete len:275 (-) Transcript_14778:171-995(-)
MEIRYKNNLFAFIVAATITGQCRGGDQSDTILPLQDWHYCIGCSALLEVYFNEASEVLKNKSAIAMEKLKRNETVDPSELKGDPIAMVENICNNSYFDRFVPEMRRSCEIIIGEKRDLFLEPFMSGISDEFSQQPGNFFEKSKQICSKNLQVCPIEVFQKGNISEKKQNICAACHIISDDLEIILSISKSTNYLSVLNVICESVKFSHNPHSWIEAFCDEIVDDYTVKIADIMRDHENQEKPQDYSPYKHSLGNKICKETMKCPIITSTEEPDL